jgi:hypothetical protein
MVTIPSAVHLVSGNRLTRLSCRADDVRVDIARPRTGAGPWWGRAGAALSFSALGLAVASLFGSHGRACPTPEGSTSLDLTPLMLFALATVAIIVDIRAVRRGGTGAFWARIGLAAVSAAALVGIWASASGFFRPGCG